MGEEGALSKIIDRSGNVIEFTYIEDGATGRFNPAADAMIAARLIDQTADRATNRIIHARYAARAEEAGFTSAPPPPSRCSPHRGQRYTRSTGPPSVPGMT
mgnify:CR=1 FL=1